MKRALVFTHAVFLFACSTVVTCRYPAAAQASPASPLPAASPDVLDNTWKNRRALSMRLTTLVDVMMAAMTKQRAAGSTPR